MIEPIWPAPPNIKSYFTIRKGGYSINAYESYNLALHVKDQKSSVIENRKILEKKIKKKINWISQVHGNNLINLSNYSEPINADGSYTFKKNKVCAVLTADCVPLLLTNLNGEFVAAIHVGWRGIENGIIDLFFKKIRTYGKQVLAYVGPTIGVNNYEVGVDVYQKIMKIDENFKNSFIESGKEKWFLNLISLVKHVLLKHGVKNVYGGNYCTFSNSELFFSYRRDGVTGRIATLIWKE